MQLRPRIKGLEKNPNLIEFHNANENKNIFMTLLGLGPTVMG
jgi:hypothetical protein